MELVDEIFALPAGLEPIGNVAGFELYGSAELNAKFIDAMLNSSYSNLLKGVDTLVNGGLIVPAYTTKNFVHFLANKVGRIPNMILGKDLRHIAFMDFNSNKIYFLLENSSNVFGQLKNDDLADTMIHELCHLFCAMKPKTYLRTFMNELGEFYITAYGKYFGFDIPINVCGDFVKKLCLDFELSKTDYNMKQLHDFYKSTFLPLAKENNKIETENKITKMIYAFYFESTGDPRVAEPGYYGVHVMFKNAYNKAFGFDSRDISCIQAVGITSEVISTISTSSKIVGKITKIIPEIISSNIKRV
jgi:hypothetical protein